MKAPTKAQVTKALKWINETFEVMADDSDVTIERFAEEAAEHVEFYYEGLEGYEPDRLPRESKEAARRRVAIALAVSEIARRQNGVSFEYEFGSEYDGVTTINVSLIYGGSHLRVETVNTRPEGDQWWHVFMPKLLRFRNAPLIRMSKAMMVMDWLSMDNGWFYRDRDLYKL